MLCQLILLQFSAHLLADFILQPLAWSDGKSKNVLTRHHFYHGLVVLITSYLLSLDFGFWKGALPIAILHFLVDCAKSYLIKKSGENKPEKSKEKGLIKYLFFVRKKGLLGF